MSASKGHGDDTLSALDWQEIYAICDRFEAAWATDQPPNLEDYLVAEWPELQQRELFRDLLIVELDRRLARGEHPRPPEYHRRFARFTASIDEAFVAQSKLGLNGPDQSIADKELNQGRETLPSGVDPTTPHMTRSRRPLTGNLIGRYRVEKKLGQGGMGEVYLARDPNLDRTVAIKLPFFSEDDDGSQRLRFQHEAKALAALQHANICPVFEVAETDGRPYLVMAYIEGRPLADYLNPDKPIALRTAVILVRRLALALQEAHSLGVIHRDLKPSNIMINQRKQPIIMDFGLAGGRQQDEVQLTKTGQFMGTPVYMSPEQISGDRQKMGAGCDIYSLGVILYELLTGTRPFSGDLLQVLSQKATHEPPTPSSLRSDIDEQLEMICLKAMSKEISDRFESMAEFASVLTAHIRSSNASADASAVVPLSTISPSTASPAKILKGTRQQSARRWLIALAVLLPLVLCAGLIIRFKTSAGTIVLEIDQPEIAGAQVTIDGDDVLSITQAEEEPIEVRADKEQHTLKVTKGGFETFTTSFTARAGKQTIKVRLEPISTTQPQQAEQPTELNQFVKDKILSATGMITDRFALWQTMSLDDSLTLVEPLRRAGYRPVRFRPFVDNGQIFVAAVWKNDEKAWEFIANGSVDDVWKKDQKLIKQGLSAVECGGCFLGQHRYFAVWSELDDEFESSKITLESLAHNRHRYAPKGSFPAATKWWGGIPHESKYLYVYLKPKQQDVRHEHWIGDSAFYANKCQEFAEWTQVEGSLGVEWHDGQFNSRFIGTWINNATTTSVESHGLTPEEHLVECHRFAAEGYEPVAIDGLIDPQTGRQLTISVWRRPKQGEKGEQRQALDTALPNRDEHGSPVNEVENASSDTDSASRDMKRVPRDEPPLASASESSRAAPASSGRIDELFEDVRKMIGGRRYVDASTALTRASREIEDIDKETVNAFQKIIVRLQRIESEYRKRLSTMKQGDTISIGGFSYPGFRRLKENDIVVALGGEETTVSMDKLTTEDLHTVLVTDAWEELKDDFAILHQVDSLGDVEAAQRNLHASSREFVNALLSKCGFDPVPISTKSESTRAPDSSFPNLELTGVSLLKDFRTTLTSATVSRSGRLAAICTDNGSVEILDLATTATTCKYSVKAGSASSTTPTRLLGDPTRDGCGGFVAFDSDESSFVVVTRFGQVDKVDLAGKSLWKKALTPPGKPGTMSSDRFSVCVACSPSSPHVAIGLGNTIGLYDLNSGVEVARMEGHTDRVRSLEFSPDGEFLYSAAADGTVRIWDYRTSRMLRVLEGHHGPVFDFAISPNGLWMTTVGGHEGGPVVWDLSSGKVVARLELVFDALLSVTFGESGQHIYCGGTGRVLACYDTASGNLVGDLPLPGDPILDTNCIAGGSPAITITADGKLYAARTKTIGRAKRSRGGKKGSSRAARRQINKSLCDVIWGEDALSREWECEVDLSPEEASERVQQIGRAGKELVFVEAYGRANSPRFVVHHMDGPRTSVCFLNATVNIFFQLRDFTGEDALHTRWFDEWRTSSASEHLICIHRNETDIPWSLLQIRGNAESVMREVESMKAKGDAFRPVWASESHAPNEESSFKVYYEKLPERSCHVGISGTDVDLVLDQLPSEWKPLWLQGYDHKGTRRFNLICGPDEFIKEWDVSKGITIGELKRQIEPRRKQGYRPICIKAE